jgi:hypothetical protein
LVKNVDAGLIFFGIPAFRHLPSSRVFTLHLDVHGVSLSSLKIFFNCRSGQHPVNPVTV